MYKQSHLLEHHRKLKENQKNELELVESFSKIDFATLDFVNVIHQIFYHYFKEENVHLKREKANLDAIKNVTGYFDLSRITETHKQLYKLYGMKTVSEGKCRTFSISGHRYHFIGSDEGKRS